MKLIPAILTNNPQELKQLINTFELLVDRVQIDIIDNKFAPNKTIDPSVINHIDTNLMLDFHLMVDSPINWIEKCFQAGANRIIGHIEHMSDQYAYVKKCQELSVKVGLALDLNTSLQKLEPSLITNLDVILLMAVPAGFGGQVFDSGVFEKLKSLINIRKTDQTPFKICIDGGVNLEHAKKLKIFGEVEVSVGRSLLKGNVESNIKAFENI